MSENPGGELVWRLLASTIGMLAAEFGVAPLKQMIELFAKEDKFWNSLDEREKMSLSNGVAPPWKRGAHDFLKKFKH